MNRSRDISSYVWSRDIAFENWKKIPDFGVKMAIS